MLLKDFNVEIFSFQSLLCRTEEDNERKNYYSSVDPLLLLLLPDLTGSATPHGSVGPYFLILHHTEGPGPVALGDAHQALLSRCCLGDVRTENVEAGFNDQKIDLCVQKRRKPTFHSAESK